MVDREPLLLTPSFKHYDWGDSWRIPQYLGLPTGSEVYAEAWYGVHPQGPAHVLGRSERLDERLQRAGEAFLGPSVQRRFGGLPYLLKFLAAARPLSIQVHPNLAQAQAGFQREEALGLDRGCRQRCYRDPNHKPEVLVALSEFYALCGFREDLSRAWGEVPEIVDLLPDLDPSPDGLQAGLTDYFALQDSEVEPALQTLVLRLRAQEAQEGERGHRGDWALRAHEWSMTKSGGPAQVDRGLLFVFLLRLIKLRPGQAIFLSAGVPHAYLEGFGLELMANSDNVLRAGLTSKHIDVAELLRVVRFDAFPPPPVLNPILEGQEARYKVPVEEFDLSWLRLEPEAPLVRKARGPETVLAVADKQTSLLTLKTEGKSMTLRPGQACLLPDAIEYQLACAESLEAAVVSVP